LLPRLHYAECSDFLQLARVVKSARLFIGNQSFPYALAEALKVPRILEVCPLYPVVTPTGDNAGEAFFQASFERLVRNSLA
jgi:ADP-heptose:LPS heptosyltransferase